MGLFALVATMLSSQEELNVVYVSINTFGFVIVYIGKNYVWPSISAYGMDVRDWVSALIVALGMAITNYAAQTLTVGFTWQAFWTAIAGAVIGYIIKTVPNDGKLN